MIVIREMLFEDLDQVLSIEEANFSVPWTANRFLSFLMREDNYDNTRKRRCNESRALSGNRTEYGEQFYQPD